MKYSTARLETYQELAAWLLAYKHHRDDYNNLCQTEGWCERKADDTWPQFLDRVDNIITDREAG